MHVLSILDSASVEGSAIPCMVIASALCVAIIGLAGYVVYLQKEIKKIYEARISDLGSNHDLVDTLIKWIDKRQTM